MFVSKKLKWIMLAVLLAGSVAARAQHDPMTDRFGRAIEAVDRKGGTDISGPYEVVPNWPRPLQPAQAKEGNH